MTAGGKDLRYQLLVVNHVVSLTYWVWRDCGASRVGAVCYEAPLQD